MIATAGSDGGVFQAELTDMAAVEQMFSGISKYVRRSRYPC